MRVVRAVQVLGLIGLAAGLLMACGGQASLVPSGIAASVPVVGAPTPNTGQIAVGTATTPYVPPTPISVPTSSVTL